MQCHLDGSEGKREENGRQTLGGEIIQIEKKSSVNPVEVKKSPALRWRWGRRGRSCPSLCRAGSRVGKGTVRSGT